MSALNDITKLAHPEKAENLNSTEESGIYLLYKPSYGQFCI